ncbi:uncharacterized protein LOC126743397 [Anthonomus grandis grandis]|uniref:uncharacterized protein LOC126743397 n=1 Tax=Anthonomus grandis grandis TaxID=2921223 RepID=UPI00216615CD|nr:uncharacterized protein LOC126743397 [Anthonomus grandis grandis]
MAEEDAAVETEPNQTADKETTFTITKVHVRPGKPFRMEAPTDPLWSNCLTTLPTIPEKPGKYKPMPYTFRLPPAPKPTHIKNVVAKSPPFHLLLDHTIAVIWMLFSPEEFDSPLGIVQLQWALAFLKTIYLRTGERPKDVDICIDNLEELLIEEYAKMNEELEKMKKINDTSHYADGAFGSTTVVTQKFPFSFNYMDLVHKLGEVAVHDQPSITSQEAQEELENIKKAAGVESIEKLDSVSKDKAINVLKMWYNEQTGKIKEEMKKLRAIQDQIKNVNDGTFQYLDATQMELLFSGDD